MSARDDLIWECTGGDPSKIALVDAYRAEILREAAEALTKKYGVTNRAAGDLRRMAEESEK